MTKPRYDEHSTEFGLWLRNFKPDKSPLGRNPDPIDSSFGYVATNIDYFWKNRKTGQFMLIEEKRCYKKAWLLKKKPPFYQHKIFKQLDEAFKNDTNYHGFYLLQFENTSPENGKIYLNRKEITKQELLDFLSFKKKGGGE